jgi:hypothetical protein
MLALKYLLLAGAIGMFIAALAVAAYDLYVEMQHRRGGIIGVEPEPLRWRTAVALVCLAWVPLLIALGIVVSPSFQFVDSAMRPTLCSSRVIIRAIS